MSILVYFVHSRKLVFLKQICFSLMVKIFNQLNLHRSLIRLPIGMEKFTSNILRKAKIIHVKQILKYLEFLHTFIKICEFKVLLYEYVLLCIGASQKQVLQKLGRNSFCILFPPFDLLRLRPCALPVIFIGTFYPQIK